MVAHERLTELFFTFEWLIAKPRSFSKFPAFLDMNHSWICRITRNLVSWTNKGSRFRTVLVIPFTVYTLEFENLRSQKFLKISVPWLRDKIVSLLNYLALLSPNLSTQRGCHGQARTKFGLYLPQLRPIPVLSIWINFSCFFRICVGRRNLIQNF